MSARVYTPFSLNEMRRLREAVVARPPTFRPDPEARARVCRNLYGKASADDSRAFAARELSEQRERAADRWGFDFLREVPRSHGPGAHKFKWTRVRIGTVPAAYKMPRLAPLNLDAVLETARVPSLPAAVAEPRDQQEQPEATTTAEAAATTTPEVTSSPASLGAGNMDNDLISPPTSTNKTVTKKHQTTMTDFLQCRKRPLTRKAEETTMPSAKRARHSEAEASLV